MTFTDHLNLKLCDLNVTLYTPDGGLAPVFPVLHASCIKGKQTKWSFLISMKFIHLSLPVFLSSSLFLATSLMPIIRKCVCLSTSRCLFCSGQGMSFQWITPILCLSSRKKCYCNKYQYMCSLVKMHKVTE